MPETGASEKDLHALQCTYGRRVAQKKQRCVCRQRRNSSMMRGRCVDARCHSGVGSSRARAACPTRGQTSRARVGVGSRSSYPTYSIDRSRARVQQGSVGVCRVVRGRETCIQLERRTPALVNLDRCWPRRMEKERAARAQRTDGGSPRRRPWILHAGVRFCGRRLATGHGARLRGLHASGASS